MNKMWVKCALIRCLKTICQTAISTIGVATTMNQVDWRVVVSTSLLSGILSLLTSVVTGLPEVKEGE